MANHHSTPLFLGKKVTKTASLVFAISILLLLGQIPTASSQILSNPTNLSLYLELAPAHVESGKSVHSIGYVYLTNKQGVPTAPPIDTVIQLKSDNPRLASVVDNITINTSENYARFDVKVTGVSGETTISATHNGKTVYKNFKIGVDESFLPNDISLQINLPTKEMHVNSEMPFSVFLKTSDGVVVRAPYDIEIFLDYEDTLATTNVEKLVIKKGDFYAWGIIQSHEKVGSAFLRAIEPNLSLDTAESIRLSSTLPSSLDIDIFPKMVSGTTDRTIDIFVSLLDSDGNPTITPEDIELELFSDHQQYVGVNLDKTMKEQNAVIKKGEFGYHLKQRLSLQNLVSEVMIGVSAPGLGVATDQFTVVGENLSTNDPKVNEKTVEIFTLKKIPSEATSIVVYQINAVEDDDDDPVISDGEISSDDGLINSIDDLQEGELYPLQSNENLLSTGSIQMINVVSDASSIIKIDTPGNIQSSSSYGTAIISSGQNNGKVMLSAIIKGVGADSILTEVVNTLQQEEIKLFSPLGDDSILFDNNGYFDLFLIPMDSKNRPIIMEQDSKYLITPINELIEINKKETFSYSTLHSDSFNVESEEILELKAIPIGVESDMSLETVKTFSVQSSSKMQIYLPKQNLNVNDEENVAVVQIVDFLGNPIKSSQDIKLKTVSHDPSIVYFIENPIIPEGKSYVTFPIFTNDKLGNTLISSNAKGILGSEVEIDVSSSLAKLKIFTSGLDTPIAENEFRELKLFVDDENAESVDGALINLETDSNITITPSNVRTGADGSATVNLQAINGPQGILTIFASAEGYADGEETFTLDVISPPTTSIGTIELELPEFTLYFVLAAIGVIISMVVVFLRKKNTTNEEEYEEELDI